MLSRSIQNRHKRLSYEKNIILYHFFELIWILHRSNMESRRSKLDYCRFQLLEIVDVFIGALLSKIAVFLCSTTNICIKHVYWFVVKPCDHSNCNTINHISSFNHKNKSLFFSFFSIDISQREKSFAK